MAGETDVGEVGSGRSPAGVDRLMVGACAAIWLVLLVVSVIAVVALVNLGRGHRGLPESSSGLLYGIIGVSAVIIIGAVALLLRARQDAQQQREEAQVTPAPTPAEAPKRPDRPQTEARTEKIRVFGTVVDPSVRPLPESPPVPSARSGAVDRVWLRGTVSIAGAVGLALIGVASAAHQLAVGHSTTAIVALSVAGVVTLAMPVVLIVASRKLNELFAEDAAGAGNSGE